MRLVALQQQICLVINTFTLRTHKFTDHVLDKQGGRQKMMMMIMMQKVMVKKNKMKGQRAGNVIIKAGEVAGENYRRVNAKEE
jgi:hypothetical protein